MKKNILIIVIILICVLAPLGFLVKKCFEVQNKNDSNAAKSHELSGKALNCDRYQGRTLNLDERQSDQEVNGKLSEPEK